MKTSPLRTAGKVAGILLFGLFAWFQRNDVDPEIYYKPSGLDATLWLLFYLLIAILFAVALFRRVPKWLLVVAAIACLVQMGRSGPGLYSNFFGEESFTVTQTSMSAEDPRVELSREFFGAGLALLGVGFLHFQQRKSPAESPAESPAGEG
ncbi:MAG: transmembrane 220 family protein [Verrucomicrobiales bacterium]